MKTLHSTNKTTEQAILIGVNLNNNPQFEYSMLELANLAQACNIDVVEQTTQNLHDTNHKYYIGTGKLDEIQALLENTKANLVIFNTELSPAQIRNIETILPCKIIDRTMLILQIFEQRAKTKEAKLQVEIARLQYFLPRLVGLRTSLDRQGGGGTSGTFNRGAGEKQLDLDRRQIENQINILKKELQTVVAQRKTQRQWRSKQGIKTVALVGYTNAGKSTLMNTIINTFPHDADELKTVFTKDMLFATLQTASRRIDMPKKKSFILTDTVGFVSDLPHHLIEAFKSTLEEICEADLLLHVIDYSDPHHQAMQTLTSQIIAELGAANIPVLHVFNKIDRIPHTNVPENVQTNLYISAKTKAGLSELIATITSHIFADYKTYKLTVPYQRGDITAFYHQNIEVLNETFTNEGTVLTISCPERLAYTYKDDVLLIEEM